MSNNTTKINLKTSMYSLYYYDFGLITNYDETLLYVGKLIMYGRY